MSIVFHEGLPGSGKSYEACTMHIIPALKKGRKVLTTIEGIDHNKFSEITGIPACMLADYLICIDHSDILEPDLKYAAQKRSILDRSEHDMLIVIDEIQDLFPSERNKLTSEWSRFIASHRHDGQDIILMGQSFSDMHNFWRRRVQRKFVFIKQTGIGRPTHYSWQAWECTTPEKFKKITSGTRKYEKKYFGLYASHTSNTKNTDAYADKRTVIFNTSGFKYGIPAFIFILFYAGNHIIGFFSPEPSQNAVVHTPVEASTSVHPKTLPTAPPSHQAANTLPAYQASVDPLRSQNDEPKEYVPIDAFDELLNRYKPRLVGVISNEHRFMAHVEFLDSSFHRQDAFNSDELTDMGWTVTVKRSGLLVKKGDVTKLIRAWPVDSWGQVNAGTVAALGANSRGISASRATTGPAVPRAVLISHSPRERMQARPSVAR